MRLNSAASSTPPARSVFLTITIAVLLLAPSHGLAAPLERTHLLGDVLELGVPIPVRRPFLGLPIHLQAVVHLLQEACHRLMADGMPLAGQRQYRWPAFSCLLFLQCVWRGWHLHPRLGEQLEWPEPHTIHADLRGHVR